MASDRTSIIALISDLGTRDPALAQFKITALGVNPNIEFIDISHEIRPRYLIEAAFTLERVFRDFPRRTIFVVLVEALLGAVRRPLLAVSMDYYYLAPDNGVLSFVYQHDSVSNVYGVTAEHLVRGDAGPLCVHRDVYAMAAGWLAKGLDSSNFGEPVTDVVRSALPVVTRPAPQQLQGMVLAVQRHGGLVTNVHENDINAVRQELGANVPFRAVVGDKTVPVVSAWSEGMPETFALYGPAGYLEIVSARGEASKVLAAKQGDPVNVVFGG